MRAKKINKKFEFPAVLNLEPYTVEGIEWRENKEKDLPELSLKK